MTIPSIGGKELFYITALSVSGESQPSNTWTNTVPGVPVGLTAVVVTANRIDLSWILPSDATQVAVDISTDNLDFRTMAVIPMPATFYISTGLNRRTLYWYRIRAGNPVGWSANCEAVAAKTDKR